MSRWRCNERSPRLWGQSPLFSCSTSATSPINGKWIPTTKKISPREASFPCEPAQKQAKTSKKHSYALRSLCSRSNSPAIRRLRCKSNRILIVTPPMEANPIFESFLAAQGLALFEYLGKGSFRSIGAFPSWLKQIWGDEAVRSKTVVLAERSPFLQNFLLDAEQFWNTKSSGAANSGNWIERGVDGVETPLAASAFRPAGKKFLLVRNPSAALRNKRNGCRPRAIPCSITKSSCAKFRKKKS